MSFSSLFLRIQSGTISTIVPTEYPAKAQLDKVYVGSSRDKFNIVESSHSVVGVCTNFGSFIKFVVIVVDPEDTDLQFISKQPRIDEESACSRSFPTLISKEKNRKDGLYNAIVKFCSQNKLNWREPEKYGKQFIQDLCNLLWYIDGHHSVLSSQSCPIPLLFSNFIGYNKPELSKHRKRSISNLSRDKLLEHASALQDHATSSWIQQPQWTTFKVSLIKLIESISSYASYLSIRNKAMKQHHSSPEPSVNFSNSSIVHHLLLFLHSCVILILF